jgi:sulfide dehydrogenase [flavocytochrome c] flavoprotein chain
VLQADRIVLAPGIAFDAVPGLSDPTPCRTPGRPAPQTTLLASQLGPCPPTAWPC